MAEKVVFIGGGLGGLVCGCLLANEGYEVEILEKHSIIGGGLHCFTHKGVNFETGIHYIGGFREHDVLFKIFNYLGIARNLAIQPLDTNGFDVMHVGSDGRKYRMGVGRENYTQILIEEFPEQAENIRNYVAAMYSIADDIPLFNLRIVNDNVWYFDERFLVSVGEFIKSYITDYKLQQVLAWSNTLYAGEENTTPAYIHTLVTKFCIEGASRFVGGTQQLANAMTSYIEDRGGRVITNTKAARIEVENKRIEKILSADNRSFTGDYYILAIHPAMLLDMIDPEKIQHAYRNRLQNLENTYSAVTVFVIFKPGSFPFMNHNYYYFDDYETVWNSVECPDELFPPGFMMLTPTCPNQGEFAEKAIINCVIKHDRFEKWSNTHIGKRGSDYYELKARYQKKILDKVDQVFPGFNQCVQHAFSSTPLTLRDYLGSKNGSLYGYKKDCRNIVQTQILPRTKLENLLLTGQNINLHGIIGVPLSAIVTAGTLVGYEKLLNKINEANN